MRRCFGVVVVVACVCAFGGAAPQEERDSGPSMKDLIARIDALEKRIAAMEKAESHRRLTIIPLDALPDDAAAPARVPAPPRAWSQQEFNGQPVYIVPLRQE